MAPNQPQSTPGQQATSNDHELVRPQEQQPDLREQALLEAKQAAAADIGRANIHTVAAGQISDAAQKHLHEYFQGAINKFDTNKDNKLSPEEARNFSQAMREKTQAIVKEAQEAVKKQEDMKKSAEKAGAELQKAKPMENLDAHISSISKLIDGADIQAAQEAMNKAQTQNTALQQSVATQVESIQQIHQSLQLYSKEKEGYGFLKYAWLSAVDSQQTNAAERELQAKLEKTKAEANAKLADLQAKKQILDENAKTIQLAIAQARQQAIIERDQKLAEIANTKDTQSKEVQEKQQKYLQLDKAQQDLQVRHDKLDHKAVVLQKRINQNEQDLNNANLAKERLQHSQQDATTELQALQLIANDPHLTPEAKSKAQEAIQEVSKRLERAQTGVKLIDEGVKTGTQVQRQLSDAEKAAKDETTNLDKYISGQLEPARKSMSTNIADLEMLKFQYATTTDQVKNHYNKRVEDLDKYSESVNEYNFHAALSRDQALQTLTGAVRSLDNASVDAKALWNPLNYVQAPLAAVAGLAERASHGIEKGMEDLMKKNAHDYLYAKTSGDALLAKTLVYFNGGVTSVSAGMLSGALELGGGVFNMAAHPLETIKGMATLTGANFPEWDPRTWSFNWDNRIAAWSNLARAMSGMEQWEKGNYGVAAGKAGFNVLSMLVGAGEAGAAGKVGMIGRAGSAARIARLGKLGELGLLPKAAVAAETAAEVGQAAGKASRAVSTAAKAGEIGSHAVPFWAGRGTYAAKFAGTLIREASPAFIREAVTVGKGEGFLGRTAAIGKSLGRSVKAMPGRALSGTFNLGKTAARVGFDFYKTLFTAPFKYPARLAKLLYRGAKGEGLLQAYRAGKVAEAVKLMEIHGGPAAKAREKITAIIESDPHLHGLNQKGGDFAKAAHEEALYRLSAEHPDLAASLQHVEKAVGQLSEASEAMNKHALEQIEKIKNKQSLKIAKDEYAALDKAHEQAKAAYKAAQESGDASAITKAQAELDSVAEKIRKFERSEMMPDYLAYQEADAAGNALKQAMENQKPLYDSYLNGSSQDLALLETEVGEARALARESRGEPGRLPAQDPQVLFDGIIKEYQEHGSVKLEDIKKQLGSFGKREDIGKFLESMSEAAIEDSTLRSQRRQRIKQFRDQNPETWKGLNAEVLDAVKRGDIQKLEQIKLSPDRPHPGIIDDLAFEYRSKPGKLMDLYLEHQKGLVNLYEQYTSAWEDLSLTKEQRDLKLGELQKHHPAWEKALTQLSERREFVQKYLQTNLDMLTARMQAELPSLLKPTDSLEQINQKVSRYMQKHSTLLGDSFAAGNPTKSINIRGHHYNITLEGEGKIRLEPIKSSSSTSDAVQAANGAAQAGVGLDKIAAPVTGRMNAPISVTQLRENLNFANGVHARQKLNVKGAKQRLQAAEEALAKARATNQLPEQLEKLEKSVVESRGELQVLEQDVAQLRQEVTKARSALQQAKFDAGWDDTTVAHTPVSTSTTSAAEATTTASLPEPLTSAVERRQTAAAKIAELDKEIGNIKNQLNKAQEKLTSAKASQTHASAPHEVQNYKTRVEAGEQAVQTLEGQLKEKQSALAKARAQWRGAIPGSVVEGLEQAINLPARKVEVKQALDGLAKIKGIPGKMVERLRTLFAEQQQAVSSANFSKIVISSRPISRYLQLLMRESNGDAQAHISSLALHQYILAGQLAKTLPRGSTTPLTPEQFSALPTEQKLATLSQALAHVGGTLSPGDLYTPQQLDHIGKQTDVIWDAIDGLTVPATATEDEVKKRLDIALGPVISVGKPYEVTIDNITVSVDADGKRNYAGIDKWLSKQPVKPLIGKVFHDTVSEYSHLTPEKLAKLNGGTSVTTLEGYKTHLTSILQERIDQQVKAYNAHQGTTKVTDFSVASLGRDEHDQPFFSAHVDQDGKVTVDISDAWATKTYPASAATDQAPK